MESVYFMNETGKMQSSCIYITVHSYSFVILHEKAENSISLAQTENRNVLEYIKREIVLFSFCSFMITSLAWSSI